MHEQPEFKLKIKTEKEVDPRPMIQFLERCDDWILAKDFPFFDARQLRAMAQASNGQIISGNRGYKLTKKATLEEISICTNRLKSQATEMTRRSLDINRVYHQKTF